MLLPTGQANAIFDKIDEPILDPESSTSLEKINQWFEWVWKVRKLG